MLLTDTAKTKTATLQKRRNLFGLGVTSLIAACSGADGAGGGGTDPLPFKAGALTDSGYSADISGDKDSLTVEVNKPAPLSAATLNFSDGTQTVVSNNTVTATTGIYQLTPTENQYDLVISAPTIDKNSDSDNLEYQKGRIFIYWDVAKVTGKGSTHLEIKGATREDRIGVHAPDFLKIGGTDNKYDMVIRSQAVDKSGTATETGAIYILWDVADYKTTTSITLDSSDENIKDAGLLIIHGAKRADFIGNHEPKFLQIGGVAGEKKLDMVIRSDYVDKTGDQLFPQNNNGAIYILWDVEDYTGNKTIDLGAAVDASGGNGNEYATSGLLTIYGKAASNLGSDDKNILYGSDGELTNIDNDSVGGGTKDIAFRGTYYTYILFGNKIAEVDGGDKVKSKSIDLAKVQDAFAGEVNPTSAGFFEYDFKSSATDISDGDEAKTTAIKANATGYRFALGSGSDGSDGYKTLEQVQDNFPQPIVSLSDVDADLGVWDIA